MHAIHDDVVASSASDVDAAIRASEEEMTHGALAQASTPRAVGAVQGEEKDESF